MTPKEAAAKVREMVRDCAQVSKGCTDEYSKGFHYGKSVGLDIAAALIDKINQPQPWPPPREWRHALVFSRDLPEWIKVVKGNYVHWDRCLDELNISSIGAVYLPMPPAPEVKG